MPWMMYYLHHYQIIEREPASRPNKTISGIKADSENAVLASRKPWRDRMELSDFDKYEICINCKIIHNKQDNKQYTIKKNLWIWVSNYYLFITIQINLTNVYVRPTDWATVPFKILLWYKLFWYHNTVNMNQPPYSFIWCNGKIHLTVSLSQDIVNEQ